MVKLREAEFDNGMIEEEVKEMEGTTEDFKLYTIDGTGQELCIKEVPYFSEEAKELLSMRQGMNNKKKEMTTEELQMFNL